MSAPRENAAPHRGKLLCLVICGAGPASDFMIPLKIAESHEWQVQVIATEAALPFIDTDVILKQTSRPVKSRHNPPGSPRSPRADAMIVGPASFNTLNKLALGISDTYALDRMHEAIGMRIPFVLCPSANNAYTSRVCYQESVGRLTQEGVHVLADEPHKPGEGGNRRLPWGNAFDIIEALLAERSP